MIVKNVINEPRYSISYGVFEYAALDDRCELILKNGPVICDEREDYISLKGGEYRIENGILYIKASRIFWKKISRYCEEVDVFGLRKIYLPNESFQENVENPPEVRTVVIKRWWRNNKKIQAIELFENDPIWYKQKQEFPFEMAIENFRLNESALANEIQL
jgi:hypothetical protein